MDPQLTILDPRLASMPEPSKAELLCSLGRLVRGLSALFWGLPLTLIVYVQTAQTDWLDAFGPLGMLPAVVVSGLLLFAIAQMGQFQKQERIWHQALFRAEVLGIINLGLAPFLFWWHRLPFVPLYTTCVALLALSSLLFLININRVLLRLVAMLPDETLRAETRMFTNFNCTLLTSVFFLLAIYFGMQQINAIPDFLVHLLEAMSNRRGIWLVLFLTLMPFAMTMALIWKIKEVIFASVLEARA